jgi:hypothetical protein
LAHKIRRQVLGFQVLEQVGSGTISNVNFKGKSLHTLDFFSWLALIEDNPSFSFLKGEREWQIGWKV